MSLAPGIALPVQIHVAGRRRGCHFAVIEKVRLPIRHANEHEPAATNISCSGMHHRQRESRGHRCIDGIPAGLHNFHADMRSQIVHAHHDCVLRVYRVHRRRGGSRSAYTQQRYEQQNQYSVWRSHSG